MKKNSIILMVILLFTLTMNSLAFAQDNTPNGVTQISTWTLSPNPAPINGTLTTNIAFTFLSADATTQFCIEGPSNAGDSAANWHNTMPATISLNLSQGFNSETVSFAQSNLADSQSTCPGGTYVALYTGTHTGGLATSSPIDVTTGTGANINLAAGSNSATAGTGNWTLTLAEAFGSPGSIGYALQLEAAQSPDTGLTGRLIDSKTLQPWAYGAEVQVIQTTGTNTGLKGSTFVSLADGTWTIDFDSTDDLTLCSGTCSPGNNFATYQVQVNFTCDLQPINGSRPAFDTPTVPADPNCPIDNGTPLTGLPLNFEITVTDSASGGVVNVGDAETERGPTAVNLLNINIAQTQPIQLVWVTIMLLGLAFTGIIVWRRKTQS